MTTKTIPFEPKGHWLHRDRETATVEATVIEIGDETVFYLDRRDMSYSCALCGDYVELSENNPELVSAKEPCPAKDGLTTVTRFEVTSGKILVTDDVRPVFDGFDHDHFASYNSVLGQQQVIQAFADLGVAFGPVGNSCPGLWCLGEGEYQIARMPYDDGEDSPTEGEEIPEPAGAMKLAGIITDLWAYSIVDYDRWVEAGGDPDALTWAETVLDFPNGTYEVTYHGGELDFSDDKDHVVWADIKRVDE